VPQQYDVFRTSAGTLVVVIQSDLLEAMRTRVVVPLLRPGQAGKPMRGLNPELRVGEETVVLMPQLAATLTVAELGRPMGSLAQAGDAIVRAVDVLLSGV
jgi:toxin CcdB